VIEQLGRLAEVGDRVEIDQGEFRVERLDGRRVERIRFTPRIDAEEVELL
jgi:CBS domain containing-hemolysin-like protein